MSHKIVKSTVDHLEDISVSLGAEFLDKKIDYEYKKQDGASIVSFEEKKDLCHGIRLRILFGKHNERGDIVDELIIKKLGEKARIKRFFVKKDYIKSNLEKFHKEDWSHYKEVKKYKIKEYVKKLYKGFRFGDKKREGSKSLKKLLKELGILISSIADTLGLEDEEDDNFDQEMEEYVASEEVEAAEAKAKEGEAAEGEAKEAEEPPDTDPDSAQALETRKPSRLRSILKKIAFTVATVALTAVAAPVAGAIIAGGARAIQGAKMAQSSLQSLRVASSPFSVVKTVVKKTVTEAGKQIIGDHGS